MKQTTNPPSDAEQVVEMLWELWRTWRVRSKTVETDITSEQYRLLKHMTREGPLSVSALAAFWGVSASTMSIATRRLERAGYVTRLRSADDLRTVAVTVTSAGREAWERWHQQRIHALAPLIGRLGQADQDSLARMLEILLKPER